MKRLLTVLAATTLGPSALAASDAPADAKPPAMCTLKGQEFHARVSKIRKTLEETEARLETVEGGLDIQFANDGALADLIPIIVAERQCCLPLKFVIVLEPDQGPVRIEVRGKDTDVAAIRALLGPAPTP